MTKDLEVLEALDKLEECAYAIEFLPMSNWIDLAENEAELDLKIMDWVETIKLELFKGKQALQRLEAIDNTNPSEALNYLNIFINEMTYCLEHPKEYAKGYDKEIFYKYKYSFETTIKQTLLKAQKQEKENELLKEIIRSLFDRGCPLHQYTDKDFGLTIEVDNECSTMILGEFKGVDLDKKLKEVLE